MFLENFIVYVPTEAPERTTVPTVASKECPKCGTIKKSGKLSCCGRGGTWFRKCGAVGDTNFDNTWVEGINACDSFANPYLTQALARARHDRTTSQSTSTTEQRHAAEQDVGIYRPSNLSDSDAADCKEHAFLAKIVVLISSLLVHLCLQTKNVY